MIADERRRHWARAGGWMLAALVLGGVFASWLRPDMLLAFANAILLCF